MDAIANTYCCWLPPLAAFNFPKQLSLHKTPSVMCHSDDHQPMQAAALCHNCFNSLLLPQCQPCCLSSLNPAATAQDNIGDAGLSAHHQKERISLQAEQQELSLCNLSQSTIRPRSGQCKQLILTRTYCCCPLPPPFTTTVTTAATAQDPISDARLSAHHQKERISLQAELSGATNRRLLHRGYSRAHAHASSMYW